MDLPNLNKDRQQQRRKTFDPGNMVFGKIPPQSKELEEAVLGAIMIERSAYEKIADIITPPVFYVEGHQRIFKAMASLSEKRMPIDLLTVVEELKATAELELVGGPYYISKLTNGVVSSANIEAHSRIILQKFLSRELIRIGGEMIGEAYEDTTDVFDLLDKSEESISSLRHGSVKLQYRFLQSIVHENLHKLEELRLKDESITGVVSGFNELDMVTCGWQATDLIILAARPSVGKTAFALTLAKQAATSFQNQFTAERKKDPLAKQKSVGFFSLEMKDSQLVNRILAQESNVWLWRFKNGKLDDEQMRQVYSAAERLNSCQIMVDETASLPIPEFRSKARQMKRKENVGLIIVDYLQLMTAPNINNREQQISYISRELKATAKELQIPIIALSQLSREIEKGGGKVKREPQLSDIRESGAIEQDADMVMFLYRPNDFEIAEDSNLKDIFYLKIEKHRSGALAKFIGKFTGEDQKHHYLKVVDNTTLQPVGTNWKPIQSAPVNFYESKKEQDASDDLPF